LSGTTKIKRVIFAASLGLVLIAGLWYFLARQQPHTLVVRVGVDQSPPFYLIQPDGSVRGLAVDVLNEAARRSGIRLRWVPVQDVPLDDLLKRRVVDMWPLVGVTPERRAMFHLTSPWIESEYVLLSRRESPIRTPTEAAGRTVAHARLRFTGMIAKEFLPRSNEAIRHLRSDAVQALCAGEADAVLIESNALDAIMLSRPAGCEKTTFQIANLTGATTPLTIASVPEIAAEADRLRDEISAMGEDGFLSERMDQWSPFAAQGTRSILAEEAANSRSRIYSYCLVAILVFAAVLAWMAWRAVRLRRAAAAAEAGRREIQQRFTTFMDHSPAVAFMKDAAGRMLYANRAWTEAFRMSADRVVGKNDFDLFPAETAALLRATDEAILAEDKPRQLVEQVSVPRGQAEGETREFLVVKFPFANEAGERFLGGTAIDITERELALRELAASETRYRELFDHNPLPAWVYDCETLAFLTVNEAAVERYGWSREEFLSGMTLMSVISGDIIQLSESDAATIDRAHAEGGSWRHQTKTGMRLSVDVTSYELEYNKRAARLTIMRDLTDQERVLEQLRISEERWQLALRGAGDALWDWDLITDRVYRSPRWCLMLGYREGEIGDTRDDFLRLLHPDDVETTLTAIEKHLSRMTVQSFCCEYRLQHKDGTWRWIMDRGQAVWDHRGIPVRMAGSHTDITDRKATESLLTLQARTDALTGVANRREFERLFQEHFRTAREHGESLTLCICDLDHFKDVNDFYGHAAGDRVLIAFADILRSKARRTDVLARMGGDEFVISFPNTTAAEATAVVERMRHELRMASFEAAAGLFHVTSSFGVAELRGHIADADELMAEADRLLYDAKGMGRDRMLAA
jgi:diguanylate cyclase (GGDEF)-like protein/PAS domain S-box-containing protein